MFEILLGLGFATLIVRFSKILIKTESNLNQASQYFEQAQKKLLELKR